MVCGGWTPETVLPTGRFLLTPLQSTVSPACALVSQFTLLWPGRLSNGTIPAGEPNFELLLLHTAVSDREGRPRTRQEMTTFVDLLRHRLPKHLLTVHYLHADAPPSIEKHFDVLAARLRPTAADPHA